MYLHLGQDQVVRTEDIIGIFDLDTTTIGKATRDYLARAEKAGEVINITDDLPKTFVVCCTQESGKCQRKETVYISQISSPTLRKRTSFLEELANI